MRGKTPTGWGLILLLAFGGALPGWATVPDPVERDVLVYHDGDRVQGRLTQEADGVIVFTSDRFGELRVSSSKAVVIKARQPEPVATAKTDAPAVIPPGGPAPAPAPVAVEPAIQPPGHGKWYSPAMLTAELRDFFNPWTGRFAFSSETVKDSADRSNLSVELTLKRKWKTDEVQLKGRYDFSRTAELTTTDMLKADGLWRHDLKKKGFIQYRPSLEWSQASYKLGVPTDYVVIQQEFGAGWTVHSSARYQVRLGASENLFDVWSLVPPEDHTSLTAESAFIETEIRLPWSMLLTQRGVVYYSFHSGDQGSENRVELTKKFSETLSAAIRHEMRRGSPDRRAQDYTRVKLLLGVDF